MSTENKSWLTNQTKPQDAEKEKEGKENKKNHLRWLFWYV